MSIRKKLQRVILFPIGLIKGIIEIGNNNARDIQNKKRFPDAIIDKGSSFSDDVKIGKNVRICNNCIINHSSIGSYTYLNYGTLIQHTTIGNYCSISHNVKMGLGAHPLDLFSTSPIFYKVKNALGVNVVDEDIKFKEYAPITIGNDVWIGSDVIIMDGVEIGNGAVVAAGAVVTKNVPAYAIMGGVPAKLIKYRFSESKISSLERSKWWEDNPKKVNNRRDSLFNM